MLTKVTGDQATFPMPWTAYEQVVTEMRKHDGLHIYPAIMEAGALPSAILVARKDEGVPFAMIACIARGWLLTGGGGPNTPMLASPELTEIIWALDKFVAECAPAKRH